MCSFSNKEGGHIFLGVRDNGEIIGIQKDRVAQMKKNFVTAINNRNKINPPLYILPLEYEYDGKTIIYIHIPFSQSVYRCGGKIFDRNFDSDIDINLLK